MGFPTFRWLVPHSKEKHPLTVAHKEVNNWIAFTSLALSHTCPSHFISYLVPSAPPHTVPWASSCCSRLATILGTIPISTLQNSPSPHVKHTNSPLFRFCKIYLQLWGLLWIVNPKLQPSLSVPNIPDVFYSVTFFCSFHHLANHKIYASVMFITNCIQYELYEGIHFCLFFSIFSEVFVIKTRPVDTQ